MKKGDLVIYCENSPHITKLELGKIYTLSSKDSVSITSEFDRRYIELSNVKFLSKGIYKSLLKNYDQNYLELIFKDISNFIFIYKQNFLKNNSLGLMEHMDNLYIELIPYIYNQKKLYDKDLFSIINIFQEVSKEDFDKVLLKNKNLYKEYVVYINEINNFFNNIDKKISSNNVYKYGLEIINNKESEDNKRESRWTLESRIRSRSGEVYDEKYYKTVLIMFYVDLINDKEALNIKYEDIDNYIDIKNLFYVRNDYWEMLDKIEYNGIRTPESIENNEDIEF